MLLRSNLRARRTRLWRISQTPLITAAEASNNATVATREPFIGGKLRARIDER